MWMPLPKKEEPKKPKVGECHCAYKAYCMELNVDALDIPVSAYINIKNSCPVHRKKEKGKK
jgi:hypothetical protein